MIERSNISNRLVFELSDAEFALAVRLAVFGSRPFRIKMKDMSAMTGMSISTVQHAIKGLEERGYMRHSMCCVDGKIGASIYSMNLPKSNGKHFISLHLENEIKRIPYNCLRVYAYLVARSGRTGMAYPSEYKIADDLHISRCKVRSCMSELEQLNVIAKEKRYYSKNRATKALRSFAYILLSRIQKNHFEIRREIAKRLDLQVKIYKNKKRRHRAIFGLLDVVCFLLSKIGIIMPSCRAKRKRFLKSPRAPDIQYS